MVIELNPGMLHERYVDDIDTGMEAVEPGIRYFNGQLIITEESQKEEEDITPTLH